MSQLIRVHGLILLLVALSWATNFDNAWHKSHHDPEDNPTHISHTSPQLTTPAKIVLTKRNDLPMTPINCGDSDRCGCYKGNCWAYIDEYQNPSTGWWCFTQREGVRGMEKAWAKCTNDTQCTWKMTCGDCWTWVGRRTGIKTDKIIC